MDSYTGGTVVPGFELKLKWIVPDRPPVFLDHPLVMHGASNGGRDVYITLYVSEPGN